ncbi:hypothetical protein D3C75_978870 [compost metagenome]
MYPSAERATRTSSALTSTSRLTLSSSTSPWMSERRSIPYLSRISISSFRITAINFLSLSRIPCSTAMRAFISSSSFWSEWISRLVNLYSCKVRIESAWRSLKPNIQTRLFWASWRFFDALMAAMTSSRMFSALTSPSRTWARSSAFSRSNRVRWVTTSR